MGLMLCFLILIAAVPAFSSYASTYIPLTIEVSGNQGVMNVVKGGLPGGIAQDLKQLNKDLHITMMEESGGKHLVNKRDATPYTSGVCYYVVFDSLNKIDEAVKSLGKLINSMDKNDQIGFFLADSPIMGLLKSKKNALKELHQFLNQNKGITARRKTGIQDPVLGLIAAQNYTGKISYLIEITDDMRAKNGCTIKDVPSDGQKAKVGRTAAVLYRIVQGSWGGNVQDIKGDLKNVLTIKFQDQNPFGQKTTFMLESGVLTQPLKFHRIDPILNALIHAKDKREALPKAENNGERKGLYPGKPNVNVKSLVFFLFTSVAFLLLLLSIILVLLKRRTKKKEALMQVRTLVREDTAGKSVVGIAENNQKPRGIYFDKDQYLGRKEDQKDSFGISELEDRELVQRRGVLAAVADGLGGMNNGKLASETIVTTMLENFKDGTWNGAIPRALKELAVLSYKEVLKKTAGYSGKSGSTLAAVVVKDNFLFWLSIGNSRVYLYRKGLLVQMTKDHVYGNWLDERVLSGEISSEEAKYSPKRRVLTSYLGVDSITEIDQNILPFQLQPGDLIALCTDGVWNALGEEELCRLFQRNSHHAAKGAVELIKKKNIKEQDTATIITIKYD